MGIGNPKNHPWFGAETAKRPQMKRAVVEWQIEGSLEIEVPVGSSERQINKLARAAVQKEAGPLSSDITRCDVVSIEHDEGGF